MSAKLRSISTAFWSDPAVEEMTPEEKLLFIYLLTNDKTNMLGVYEMSVLKMSFETGLKKDTVRKALEAFERLRKIRYEGTFVVVLNYLKHQKFNLNMKKSAISVYNNLPDKLKVSGLEQIKDTNALKGFERLCEGFGMVRKVEVEGEVKNEAKAEDEIKSKNLLLSESKDSDVKPEEVVYLKTAKAFQALFVRNLEEAGASTEKIKKAKLKNWITPVRLMFQSDGVNEDQCKRVFNFLGTDPFWKKNILSTQKLRDQFETLLMNESNGKKEKKSSGNSGISSEFAKSVLG